MIELDDHRTLEPDPETSKIVAEAARRYLAGETVDAICADFSARHIASPKWLGKPGKVWYAKTLASLLRNPSIAGRRVDKTGKTVLRYKGIITWDEHKRIVARLDSRAHRKGISPANTALLTSVLFCDKCKRPMYRIKSRDRKDYYYCYPRGGKGCRMLVPVTKADAWVIAYVHRGLARRPYITWVTIPGKNHQEEIDQLAADMDELDKASPDWPARVTAMHAELTRLRELPSEPDEVRPVDSGVSIAAKFAERNPVGKREMLIELGKVYYDGKKFRPEFFAA